MGMESMKAVARPVTALVAPGPEVTRATPACPYARVGVGHMGGRLLVPYQYAFQCLLLKNRIVNMQGSAARVAEDVFHTFVLERANKSFTVGQQFHDHSSIGSRALKGRSEHRTGTKTQGLRLA